MLQWFPKLNRDILAEFYKSFCLFSPCSIWSTHMLSICFQYILFVLLVFTFCLLSLLSTLYNVHTFMITLYVICTYYIYILWILFMYYRVTHKGWDIRDNCTEFVLSIFLHSGFIAWQNWLISELYISVNHKNDGSFLQFNPL